jgi:hypothetical protein
MKIKDTYKPYNFSKSKCHVIKFDVRAEPILKIEEKLPLHIEKLTGIYITCNALSREHVIGYITVMFNEGILKTTQLPILNSAFIRHHSHPIPLNEIIKSNSMMLGYLYFRIRSERPYTVKIYLHYEQ